MKIYFSHIFFITLLFLFQACRQKTDLNSKNYKPGQELKILLNNLVETLDLFEILYVGDWKAASNIFEAIVSLNENDIVVPSLALSYSISSDRKKYSFKIRNSVYFHDSPCFPNGKGRKLNTNDIKYTFERLADSKNNFPNTFNPTTTIKYTIPNVSSVKVYSHNVASSFSLSKVTLEIYNLLGKKVATLINKKQKSGNYHVTFSAESLSSGIYLYRLRVGNKTITKKCLLLK